MTKRFYNIVLLSAIGMCATSFYSCKEDKKPISPVVVSFKKEGELSLKKAKNDSVIKRLEIEIADDDYQTQTGLMYRNSMQDNQGMLFIFPEAQYHSFYMKNTQFSLDIVYIGADKKIVSIQKNAKPFDESSLPSEAPAKYVLELNGGMSDAWNLEVGDVIEYSAF